jgi:hypothetical protein
MRLARFTSPLAGEVGIPIRPGRFAVGSPSPVDGEGKAAGWGLPCSQ